MKRVLLDEMLPRRLRSELVGVEAHTVADAGWSGKKNSALLRLAEQEFDVFLTGDKNLPHQQTLGNYRLGFVILDAPRIRLEDLRPLIPAALEAISSIAPGELKVVR